MALDAKVIFFDKSTNTSVPVNQTVTGIGFTPKALIFFHTDTTSHGAYQEGAQFAIGFSCGSGAGNNKSMSQRSNDNVTRSECARFNNADSINAMSYTAASLVFAGQVTSFNSDGFVIQWTTNNASAVKIGVIALGGSSLTNAFVGTGTTHNLVATKAYTGVGFQPDCVMTLASSLTAFTSGSTGSTCMVFGAATSSTQANNVCFGGTMEHNQTTSDTSAYLGKTHCYTRLPEGTGAVVSKARLSSFDSDGFTLDWDDADSGTTAMFAYLALKGGNYDAHSFTIPTTATAVSKTGLSFKPSAVWFASIGSPNTNDDTSAATENALTFGAADANANEITVWSGSDTGLDFTADARISKDTKCLSHSSAAATATSSTLNYEADITSMNTDGWTMTFSQGESLTGTITGIALAFGPAPSTGIDYARAPSADTTTISDASLTRVYSSLRVPSADTTTVTAGTVTRTTQAFRVPSADTVTISEASLVASKVKSGVPSPDTTTVTDSSLTRLLSATRVPSTDTTTVSDASLTRTTQAVRVPSADTTTVSDVSTTRVRSLPRVPSTDTTAVSDSSLNRMLSAIRVPSADTTVIGETLSRIRSLPRIPSADTVTISESSLTRMLSAIRLPSTETTTVSDSSLTRILSLLRLPSADTTILSESVTALKTVTGVNYTRAPTADTTTVSDGTLSRLCSLLRVPSTEIGSISDSSLSRLLSAIRTPSTDSITVADQSLVRALSIIRVPSTDSSTISDSSLVRRLSAIRTPSSDSITVSDSSLTRLLQLVRVPSPETIAINENVIGLLTTPGLFARSPSIENTLIVEQSLTRMLSLIRVPSSDTSAISDNLSRIRTLPRIPSTDTITISDASLVRLLSMIRIPSADTVSIIESSLTRLFSGSRAPTPDSQSITENLSRMKTIPRAPAADTIVISDASLTRLRSLSRSISETIVNVLEASLVRLFSAVRAPPIDIVAISELASVVSHTKSLQETISITEPILSRIVTNIRTLTDSIDIAEDLFFQTWHRYVFDTVEVVDQLFSIRQALAGPVTYAIPDEVRPLLGNLGSQRTDPQIELAIDAAYDEINTKTNRIPPNDWKDTDHNFGIVKKLTRYIAAREMAIGIKDYDTKPLDMEIEHLFNDLLQYDTTSDATQDIVISSDSLTYAASESGLIWSLRYPNLRKHSSLGEGDTTINPDT